MPEETAVTDQAAETSLESGTEVAVQTESQTALGQPAATESYVNVDGTLKEGWRDHLVHADFKGRPCYDAVGNDVKSLLKHIGNQDIAISKQGKGVFVPGENATETERDMFFKAIGRPDKPEGYEFTAPDELKQYYDDETMLNQAREAFHKVGMNLEQFTTVMALDAARMEQTQAEMVKDPMPFFEQLWPHVAPIMEAQAIESLKTKWGDAFESRFQYANMAISEATAEGEEREMLLAKYGNDPVFADFAATMYLKHHTESNGVDTSLGHGTTSMNIDQRIEKVNKELTSELKLNDRTRYDALIIEKENLYKQRYPEK